MISLIFVHFPMAFRSYSIPAVEAEKRQVRASKKALSLESPPEVGRLLLGGKKDGGGGEGGRT